VDYINETPVRVVKGTGTWSKNRRGSTTGPNIETTHKDKGNTTTNDFRAQGGNQRGETTETTFNITLTDVQYEMKLNREGEKTWTGHLKMKPSNHPMKVVDIDLTASSLSGTTTTMTWTTPNESVIRNTGVRWVEGQGRSGHSLLP